MTTKAKEEKKFDIEEFLTQDHPSGMPLWKRLAFLVYLLS